MRIPCKPFLSGIIIILTAITFYGTKIPDAFGYNEDAILYVTDDLGIIPISETDIRLTNNLETTDISSYRKIIVDKSMLSDNVKPKLQKALRDHIKLIIFGGITKSEIRQFFGLEPKVYIKDDQVTERDVCNEYEAVDVSQFESIGKLIYQDISDIDITDIKIENSSDLQTILSSFKYCFQYDYLKLSAIGKSYSYSWSNVDVDTSTYITERCTINTAIKIDRNDGNPNYKDEYLSHVGYAVDTDMNPAWYLDQTDVEVHGRATSLVYAYGPANMTNPPNTTISFGLQYSLNISFPPGPARVNIRKMTGGIDSNNLIAKFNAVTFFGSNAVTANMLAEADIESYQPASGYFYGYGQFHIKTNAYNWQNQLTYYNGSWDIVTGS